jgi:hypothetical protein
MHYPGSSSKENEVSKIAMNTFESPLISQQASAVSTWRSAAETPAYAAGKSAREFASRQ